ncbi:MAG: hypothetical protein AAB152_01890 [Candidatus Coatesbacteria bacterium]
MSGMRTVRLGCLALGVVVAWPCSGLAANQDSPEAKRESRLATYLVRRYCQPGYVMKALRSAGGTGQWTWTSILLGDGRYRVNVEDFNWDVDVATKRIDPGPAVQTAVSQKKLPDICLCVEGTPPPPTDWMPATDGEEAPASPTVASTPSPATVAPAPQHPAHSGPEPSARSRPASAKGSASASSLPGWLVGTWKGDAGGATIRLRFSADGTWRRERIEPGGATPALTVEGTLAPAGTALRLKVTTVRVAPGVRPGERPPKAGSSVDSYCYRSGDGGLIMLTSGTTFRAARVRD